MGKIWRRFLNSGGNYKKLFEARMWNIKWKWKYTRNQPRSSEWHNWNQGWTRSKIRPQRMFCSNWANVERNWWRRIKEELVARSGPKEFIAQSEPVLRENDEESTRTCLKWGKAGNCYDTYDSISSYSPQISK